MPEQSLWRRAIAAITREYDRRIRRASLVGEYGALHHGHDKAAHDDHQGHIKAPLEQADEAEILNVPKGTRVMRRTPAANPTDTAPPGE